MLPGMAEAGVVLILYLRAHPQKFLCLWRRVGTLNVSCVEAVVILAEVGSTGEGEANKLLT